MGFNTSIVALEKTKNILASNALEKLGPKHSKYKGSLSFDQALSSTLDGLAFGENDQWFIIIDPNNFDLFGRKEYAHLSGLGCVVCFLTHSVSSTYGYAIYQDGRLKRQFLIQEDEVVFDSGEVSLEEQEALSQEEFWEDKILAYIGRMGIDLFSNNVRYDHYGRGFTLFDLKW